MRPLSLYMFVFDTDEDINYGMEDLWYGTDTGIKS